MEAYLPLFPLSLVAFPGEKVNLHIFEPRYRQLIDECLETGAFFGMPAYLDGKLPGYGTEMGVERLSKRYDDGKMDIVTRGKRVFRLIGFENPSPGKLYAGGEVVFLPEAEQSHSVMPELLAEVDRLYRLLGQPVQYSTSSDQLFSYQVGHTVGLSQEGEYELLTIQTEADRQFFLLEHLGRVIPVLEDMERTKARIRMNGDFRTFGPLDLKF